MAKHQRKIEIHFKEGIHYIAPMESLTDEQIEARISRFQDLFWNEQTTTPDDVEWIWCLVGNIIGEHEWGEKKEIRKGTTQFSAGTKVYCYPPEWSGSGGRVKVIGKPRKRRTLSTFVVNTRYVVNWRLQKVFNPMVVAEMTNNFGWSSAESDKKRIEHIAAQADILFKKA